MVTGATPSAVAASVRVSANFGGFGRLISVSMLRTLGRSTTEQGGRRIESACPLSQSHPPLADSFTPDAKPDAVPSAETLK